MHRYAVSVQRNSCVNKRSMMFIRVCLCLSECDSCAQTLLSDLERLDAELVRLKAQLDSLNSSSEAQRRLRELEKAVAEAKVFIHLQF